MDEVLRVLIENGAEMKYAFQTVQLHAWGCFQAFHATGLGFGGGLMNDLHCVEWRSVPV